MYSCNHNDEHGFLSSKFSANGRIDAMCNDATCRLYAYEGVGVLLGQEELPAEEQHVYIAALLQPLIHQVRY
jgi:hypothetical protein